MIKEVSLWHSKKHRKEHQFRTSFMKALLHEWSASSKFSGVIWDKDTSKVLSVFDELMGTLEVLSPKLYAATIDRLSGIR